MNPSETEPTQNVMSSSAPETFPLIKDQLLFAESIYACLPMSIEIYDTNGILRSINEHALQMYGVTDKTTVEKTTHTSLPKIRTRSFMKQRSFPCEARREKSSGIYCFPTM